MKYLKAFFHLDNFVSLTILFALYLLLFRSCNTSIIDPISDAFEDVELTDIVYAQFDKNDEYRKIVNGELITPDTNIVIVNIGNLGREGIAQQINILNQFKPKVIGLDVIFADAKDPLGDYALEDALANVDNLVLTSRGINYDWTSNVFDSIQLSYPQFSRHGVSGYANLITKSKSTTENLISSIKGVSVTEGDEPDEDKFKVCRRIIPKAADKGSGKSQHAFSIEVCRKYNPQAVNELFARNTRVESINYLGNINYYQTKPRFRVLDVNDVLSKQFDSSWVKGKIVIMGFMGGSLDDVSTEDKFFTPLNPQYVGKANPDMHGVVIHANIISMVLERAYVDEMPLWMGHALGLFFTYLVFAGFRRIYNDARVWYDGLTKILSMILTFVVIFILCVVFYQFNYKISIPMSYYLIVLLSGDYLEIYYSFIKNVFFLAKRKLF